MKFVVQFGARDCTIGHITGIVFIPLLRAISRHVVLKNYQGYGIDHPALGNGAKGMRHAITKVSGHG